MSQMMEARKVQKVGYSTLIVSLPKDWVEQVSLKQGDIVTFRREPDGGITVYPGLTRERENLRYVIDADICDAPNLLTRIITANYLTGHDTIQIVAKKELSQRHLEEVRAVSRRLTGLGSLEQMGDLASHIAQEALRLKGDAKSVDPKLTKGILDYSDKVRLLIEDSFNALMKGDLKKSNDCIERVASCEALERSLTADIMRRGKLVNLAVGLRSIVWDVGQMAKYSEAIAEAANNRHLEEPSAFCAWEKA